MKQLRFLNTILKIYIKIQKNILNFEMYRTLKKKNKKLFLKKLKKDNESAINFHY